jgi:hypothetical protein
VFAFSTEQAAKDFVGFLSEKYRTLRVQMTPDAGWKSANAFEEAMRVFDPDFDEDYTGTSWHVDEVPWAAGHAPPAAGAHDDTGSPDCPSQRESEQGERSEPQ